MGREEAEYYIAQYASGASSLAEFMDKWLARAIWEYPDNDLLPTIQLEISKFEDREMGEEELRDRLCGLVQYRTKGKDSEWENQV